MGWRFRKSIKILPGVRINLGKRGITSATIGKRGWLSTNVNRDGYRRNLNVPGSGVTYQTQRTASTPRAFVQGTAANRDMKIVVGVLGLVFVAVFVAISAVLIAFAWHEAHLFNIAAAQVKRSAIQPIKTKQPARRSKFSRPKS